MIHGPARGAARATPTKVQVRVTVTCSHSAGTLADEQRIRVVTAGRYRSITASDIQNVNVPHMFAATPRRSDVEAAGCVLAAVCATRREDLEGAHPVHIQRDSLAGPGGGRIWAVRWGEGPSWLPVLASARKHKGAPTSRPWRLEGGETLPVSLGLVAVRLQQAVARTWASGPTKSRPMRPQRRVSGVRVGAGRRKRRPMVLTRQRVKAASGRSGCTQVCRGPPRRPASPAATAQSDAPAARASRRGQEARPGGRRGRLAQVAGREKTQAVATGSRGDTNCVTTDDRSARGRTFKDSGSERPAPDLTRRGGPLRRAPREPARRVQSAVGGAVVADARSARLDTRRGGYGPGQWQGQRRTARRGARRAPPRGLPWGPGGRGGGRNRRRRRALESTRPRRPVRQTFRRAGAPTA